MREDLSGTSLRGGEYVLKELLARGGQASVHRAFAHALETDVAIKVLHPVFAGDIGFRERFHDEARRLAQLHHPNLLEVHWYGEEGDLVYIVMRLVHGGTLLRRLQAFGSALPMTEVGRLILQIANALQQAHDHGVLHLDVKPANVLLGQADWPLVADLGLTRVIARQTSLEHNASRTAGTPAYMSPEQCRGDDLDGRADQYSLAVLAYELLTGQRPFQAETTDGLIQAQLYLPPPHPRSVNPGLPGPVEDVILRGMAKSRADRFETINEFGQALADAIDRTRGVSLETKRAAAGIAPNLLSILVLILLAPFWLAMLPVGTVFGRLPVAWPFQLLLAVAVAVLLLGIRWHLVGLVGRVASHGVHTDSWRRRARASAEGCVTLLYVLVIYRLVGGPLLGILKLMLDPEPYADLELAVVLLVAATSLIVVVQLLRTAGRLAALVALIVGWVLALILSTLQLDLGTGQSIASLTQLLLAGGVMVFALAYRGAFGTFLSRRATRAMGPLLVDSRPGITPEQAEASRQQLARLVTSLLDFAYLLVGYALLLGPLLNVLVPISSPLAAAVIVSTPAIVIWLLLVARLHWVAGFLGLGLGLVLGAPILLSLPLLQTAFLRVSWLETAAAWLAGAAVLMLLVALRGPSRAIGQLAVGARLDRGLLGTRAADTEAQSARRLSAMGRVVTAILDVVFLLAVYWIIGVPLTEKLVQATGQPTIGSVVLGGVLLLAVVSVVVAARRAAATVAESSGAVWRARARALTALAAGAAALMFTAGAAAPAAVAGPTAVSTAAYTPELTHTVDQVVVDWEAFVPWSPGPNQSTYNLVLSCSNGRPLGQFREAYTPSSGAPMPNGAVGRTGSTAIGCDNWQQVYTAHRRAAGLPDTPSHSWEWVDVQATLNTDQSVDVVQSQRVFLSAGRHSTLSWNLGSANSSSLDALQVSEGDTKYLVVPDGAAPPAATRFAQLSQRNGQRVLNLFFPETAAPALRTFVIRYTLVNALAATGDLRQFAQNLLDADHSQPIWRSTAAIRLPGQVDASSVQLASDGVAARSGLLNDHTAVFDVQDVAPGDGLSVRVTYPSGSPTASPTAAPTDTPTATPSPTSTSMPASTHTPVPVIIVPTRTPLPSSTTTPTDEPTPTVDPTETPIQAPPTATSVPPLRPTNTPVPVRVVRPPTSTPLPTTPPRRIVIVTATVP